MSEIFGYFTDVRDILRMSEIFGYFTDVREVWDIYKIPIKYRDIRGGSEPHARPDDDEPPTSTYRDGRGNHGNAGRHMRPGKMLAAREGARPTRKPSQIGRKSERRTGRARHGRTESVAWSGRRQPALVFKPKFILKRLLLVSVPFHGPA